MVAATPKARRTLVDIPLLPSQRRVLVGHRDTEVVFNIGGLGCGKTRCIGLFALQQSLEHRNNFGAIAAATYPQLRRSTIRAVLAVLDEYIGPKGYTYNKNEQLVRIKRTGSEFVFVSCDVPPEQLQGPEYGWVAIDEGEGVSEPAFKAIFGRVRKPRTPQLTRVFANPPHRGHWIEQKSLTDPPEGWALVQSNTYENRRILGDRYIRRMEGFYKPGSLQHRRYMLGEMGLAMEGAVYPEWTPSRHTISHAEFEQLGAAGKILGFVNGLDLGFGHPTAFEALALTDEDCLIAFAEHHAGGLAIVEHAEDIRRIYRGGPIYSDHDAQGRHEYERAGVLTVPAPKDLGVVEGIDMVRDRLRAEPPRLQVVRGECPALVEQFTTYRWAKPSREGVEYRDAPVKVGDDAQDALRYGVTGYEVAAAGFDVDQLGDVFAVVR